MWPPRSGPRRGNLRYCMHMRTLSRRTQLLLDEERYERLARRAEATGASVGALIRDAIDLAYPAAAVDPREAAEQLLAAEPMDFGDWSVEKERIRDDLFRVDRHDR